MVFISHSSHDNKTAKRLVSLIETLGIKCWFSEKDIDPGRQSWMKEIMIALDKCDTMLLLVSENSICSGEVHNEIANASAKDKNIIPYFIQEVALPEDWVYSLRKYEYIYAYRYDEKDAWGILRNRLTEDRNEEREIFWKVTCSEEFGEFTGKVMRRYYGTGVYNEMDNVRSPVFCVKGAMTENAASIKDFDKLCDFEGSVLSDFQINNHQNYPENKWYKEYSGILHGKVRFPNRPGYMLDEMETDSEGHLSRIRVHVGTYAENLYSTHVIEYEMYRAYLEYGKKDLDDPETWKELRESLTIRNHMHEGVGLPTEEGYCERKRSSLLGGLNRDSLLGVQMLVILRSDINNCYEVKLAQRSENVAAKPGVYQFIPSGGFEILNDSDDDVYDDLELEENFSPGCAVFREYLEELFNIQEFEGSGTGSVEERLLKDPRIIEIGRMLKDGRATLRFLGSVMELVGMRHELSFVLVIHDAGYASAQMIANEECKKGIIRSFDISDFDTKRSVWKKLHAPSAAMWYLFRESPLYKELTEERS